MAKVISKVYGDALFSLALENDKLDTIWEEVRMTRQILSENPTFVKTICHPEITKQDQIKLLDDAFKGKVSDEVMGFFHVLADKKRLKEQHLPVWQLTNRLSHRISDLCQIRSFSPSADFLLTHSCAV